MAKNFHYLDSTGKPHDIVIEDNDLNLVATDRRISDEKLKSKPTTFFKDALRRFAKNKSSVAGAIILGIILLVSFILPSLSPYPVDVDRAYEKKLLPKLFDTGTGWWDGTTMMNDITCDFDWEKYDEDGTYSGLPADVLERDIVGGQKSIEYTKVGDVKVDTYSQYGRGGSLRLWTFDSATDYVAELKSPSPIIYDMSMFDYQVDFTVPAFSATALGEKGQWAFVIKDSVSYDGEHYYETVLRDYSTEDGDFSIDLQIYESEIASYTSPYFLFRVKSSSTANENMLLSKFALSYGANANNMLVDTNTLIDDANAIMGNQAWKTNAGQLNIYQADIVRCNFRFDSYQNHYGDRNWPLSSTEIRNYIKKGYYEATEEDLTTLLNLGSSMKSSDIAAFKAKMVYKGEGEAKSPIRLEYDDFAITKKSAGGKTVVEFSATVSFYRYLGYDAMPKFLFGTDDYGNAIVTKTFSGLRVSLLLGIITSAVCFIFGLIWGSISGYFGGWVDIAMERFCEILGGLPWIVLMTIAIIKFGQSPVVFAMALCLTGWMGTASITRTQFYRFKDREYILAARTLGAKDTRLIFRHILPNAVGTIITSSVLMIPSVIFSESTIAYLGLGLQGMNSLGVILADNQQFITTYPALIVFPSVIMALMMISFNLFGNGLRDAFNPSLKGAEQ